MINDVKIVMNHPFFSINFKRNPTKKIVEIKKPRYSKIKM